MLGLVLIYFIGKRFYELADLHDRSEWKYAILGVLSYYAGSFVGGIILAIAGELMGYSIDDMSEIAIGLMAMPLGLLSCWLYYKYLERAWTGVPQSQHSDILDDDLYA